MAVRLWNIRFRIGWAILPGAHKHVAVSRSASDCSAREMH